MKSLACISILLIATLLASCSRRVDSVRWVNDIGEANQQADRALSEGNLVAARSILGQVAEKPLPAGIAQQDGLVVRKDACFRLAMLELQAGRPKIALEWADRGLGLDRRADLFTANLLVARATALEAQGKDAKAAGSYKRALEINEKLLKAELKKDSGRVKS
jgi:tetratricopeptide (TPR) repeat protein